MVLSFPLGDATLPLSSCHLMVWSCHCVIYKYTMSSSLCSNIFLSQELLSRFQNLNQIKHKFSVKSVWVSSTRSANLANVCKHKLHLFTEAGGVISRRLFTLKDVASKIPCIFRLECKMSVVWLHRHKICSTR